MVKALPSIKCVDRWPEGTFTFSRQDAYKIAEYNGEIIIDKIIFASGSGSTVVEYRSNCPEEWIHEQLKKYAEELEHGSVPDGV